MLSSRYKLFHSIFLTMACFPFISCNAVSAEKLKNAKTVASVQQSEKKATNSITQAFVAKGTKTCADKIDTITNFIGTGAITGAILYFPASQADKNLVSVSLEAVDKDKKSAYASASFAPNGTGGCSAVYDAVSWSADSCETVAEKQFAGKKIAGKVKENVLTLELNQNARVFLLPTKDGCISIKKELASE